MRSQGGCVDHTWWDGLGCEHGEAGPRLVTEGTRVLWLLELWVLPQLFEVFLLQFPKTPVCPPCQGPQGWLLGSSLPSIPHPGSLSPAGFLDGVSAPAFPRAVLAVVGAARPLASATPGLRHSLGFSEGYRQQLPPGGALWEVGVSPDPALLSSSSPYRAPSPAWPSSRSSRKHPLRTAAASQRLRGEPGAPRGIIPDPAGCSGLCAPLHGLGAGCPPN